MYRKRHEANILLFHRVNTLRDPLWDPMSPDLFRKIVAYISKKYEIFFVEEIQDIDFKKIKKPIAALTFDDGYKDFSTYALPILEEYKAKSSMYVVTDCIDNNEPTWTYIVDYLFYNTTKIAINLENYSEQLGELSIQKIENKNELILFGKKLKQYLKKVDNTYRQKIISTLKGQLDDVNIPSNLMMTWNEIRKLNSDLVIIGSHTKSHPPLATISSDDELKHELEYSYNKIHDELGFYPKTISYPVGSYNNKVMQVSKSIGYNIGLAVDFRKYNILSDDLFSIPRLELYNEGYVKSLLRAEGYYYQIKNLFK